MKSFDVVCIGMAIMDSIIRGFDPEPVSATGYRAVSGTLNVGGDAVNEAMALAKLGMSVSILCHLGNDPAGDVIAGDLTRGGVDTGYIVRSDDHPTPITTIFVREDGNRRSITNEAHSYNFHPEEYFDRIKGSRAVTIGSLFRAPFNDPDVIRSVARAAKDQGALIFADTKLPNFRRLGLSDISDSLRLIDFITPNEDEGRYYTGEDDPERMADVFLEAGANNVIIKMGAKGCLLKNRVQSIHVPAFRIDAVDATGAGDNFLAGFASEIIRGRSLEDSLIFANACGAICSTKVGAGTALASYDQVRDFIRSRNG